MSAISNAVGSAVKLLPEWLRLNLADGTTLDFHYLWLRHHCDSGLHPRTGERTLDPVDIDPDIAADSAEFRDFGETGELVVTWPEGLVSHYALSWLLDHAYSVNLAEVTLPRTDPESLTWHGPFDPQGVLRRVESDGASIVRGWGEDTEQLIARFESVGLRVRETHFGRIEDLQTDTTTNKNTDQLGYTNEATELHTDQPYLEEPPRFQLLQSVRTADQGGESLLASGAHVAAYVKASSRQDYELLTTIPVVFHRTQQHFEKRLEARLITEERNGRVRIRLSYFTLAPFRYPFDVTRDWYRAYRRLVGLARSTYFQYRFLLRPGDFVIYDNLRMLHGRTSFTGPRWVRGIYFDGET